MFVGLRIGVPAIAGLGGAGSLPAPAAPTLTLVSGAGDNQPDFLVTAANADLPIGAVVTIYAYSDAGLTTLVDTGAGTVAVAGTITITDQLGPLADGAYWYIAKTAITGHATSTASNTENNTIDTVAPTLSSPTGTKTGETTADGTVSTNEGNGTLFWVVDTGSTPSAAQVRLGKGSGGSAANGDDGNAAVIVTGAQNVSATGLTAATTYKFYYMHEDAVGNQSTVSTSASFTTDASATVTWDTVNITSGISLSGANLVATRSGALAASHTRSSTSHNTGKFYAELTLTNAPSPGFDHIGFGVMNATESFSNYIGQTSNSICFFNDAGHVLLNNVTVKTIALLGTGDVAGLAVDATARLIWFRKNGGDWNNDVTADPATGANGIDISAITGALFISNEIENTGDVCTINFSGSYAHAAPSGFGNW